jgi:hypothetical protein
VTVSLRSILAETLAAPGMGLSWVEVGEYMRRHYIGQNATAERERRARHRRRQDVYNDGAKPYVIELIRKVFRDPRVRQLREQWAEAAQFNNVAKRIVNELSTVYQEPAQRTLDGVEDDIRYQRVQNLCKQARRMRHAGRMLNLHRTILLGFRVRNAGTLADPRPEPVIDVVTPDRAFIVTHPTDPGVPVAVGIEIETRYAHTASKAPAWVVWSEHERFHLTGTGDVVEGSLIEHGIGRLPFVLVTLEDSTASVWPGMAGEDLTAAALAIAFSNTCLLKETKSATVMPIVSGDASRMVREQASDPEIMVHAPEGVSVSTIDPSMDLDLFTNTANHVQDTIGSNYGVAATLMRHQGVQSAAARDLMRVPLRELRLEQQLIWRDAEREFVEVQAAVIAAEAAAGVPGMAELVFSPAGWRIDFADPQTPRSVKEQLEEFEHARRLSLDSTVRFVQRQNPDLTEEQAWDWITTLISDEILRNRLMRPLVAMSGSMGAITPDARTPDGAQSPDSPTVTGSSATEDVAHLNGRKPELAQPEQAA